MSEERWQRWVRAPHQERARASFERVLTAAAGVLAEQGYDGFAVAEICRRARVAPGTLYDRVEDRATLFLAVHDRELERMTAGPVAAARDEGRWSRLSTRSVVDRVVALLVDHYAEEQRLLRAFILRAAVDPRVRAEGSHYAGLLEHAVVGLLLTRRDDYTPRDPARAVLVAYRLVVDSLSWRTAFGADFHATGSLGDEEWARELRDMVRRLLLG